MIERSVKGLTRRQCMQTMAALSLGGSLAPALAQAPRQMRVGFIKRYEPYSFVSGDAVLQGFDVDVVQAVLASMNVKMVPVADSLARLQFLLALGEIDFIGNQLLDTPENRRRFDFVVPYATIQLVCVLHESDDRDFFSLDDMLGRKLGVLANTGVADQARDVLGKSVRSFERIDLALKALAAKELDVVLEENLIVEYHIEQEQLPLKVGAPMAAPMRVGLAVPKGQKIIQDELSAAVRGVLKSKTFKTISNKWFGYDVSRPRVGHSGI
jgi:cystine transport system substrate-binding protein